MTSSAVPPAGPDDHARGAGPEVVLYADFACPLCAADWAVIKSLPLLLVFRHFPMAVKRPRSPFLHAAAEAAACQGAFWEFCDSLFAEASRVDDPHLWERVERLGLDLDRFEADRRAAGVADRIRRDFESGIRAGVTETPGAFVAGEGLRGPVAAGLATLAR